MSFRTVTFKSVLFGAARLVGMDPEKDLQAHTAAAIAQYATEAVRLACAPIWPELVVTEERTPDGEGFVSFAAVGDGPAIGKILDVWTANPEVSRDARRVLWCLHGERARIWADGGLPGTVWVEFEPRVPEFTAEVYSPARNYAVGDLVYHGTDCYEALTPAVGIAPPASGTWAKQAVPYVVLDIVRHAVAAALWREDGQLSKAGAEDALAQACLEVEQDQIILKQGQGRGGFRVSSR